MNRARFNIEWSTGVASIIVDKKVDDPELDPDGEEEPMDDKNNSLSTTAIALISVGAGAAVLGIVAAVILTRKNPSEGATKEAPKEEAL
jgi:hypothetical protein